MNTGKKNRRLLLQWVERLRPSRLHGFIFLSNKIPTLPFSTARDLFPGNQRISMLTTRAASS